MTIADRTSRTPVEIIPGRVWVLGDSIELDGRLSWVPATASGYQPLNTYVLKESSSAIVVDPGPAIERDAVLTALTDLLAPATDIAVLITRAEADNAGNVIAVAERYPLRCVHAGGNDNPFDAFGYVGQPGLSDMGIPTKRTPVGGTVELAPGRVLGVLAPVVRLLSTYWWYDDATHVLFTTDFFAHTTQDDADDARVINDVGAYELDVASVRAHITAKFGWLGETDTTEIRSALRELIEGREVDVIAPSHGLVLRGRDVVLRHLEVVDEAIADMSRAIGQRGGRRDTA